MGSTRRSEEKKEERRKKKEERRKKKEETRRSGKKTESTVRKWFARFNPFGTSAGYIRHPSDDLCGRAPDISGIHPMTCVAECRIYLASMICDNLCEKTNK
ncbi:hypothetical protein ANTQUA_LOCUS2933 [Anthophora quadrimaculata]